MRERFIPALITLIAGAVTCIIDIYRKADLLSSLKRLLLVLVIFYMIGLAAKAIIKKVTRIQPKNESEATEDESGDSAESDDAEQDKPEDKYGISE